MKDHGMIHGPYPTRTKVNKQLRWLISSDRGHLYSELHRELDRNAKEIKLYFTGIKNE